MHNTEDMTPTAAAAAAPRVDTPGPRGATNPRRVSPWADRRVLDAAIMLYRQGCSAAEVAAALLEHHQVGVTRNAVIGAMHRLGVKGGGGNDAGAHPRTRPPARSAGTPRRAPRPRWRAWAPSSWRRSAAPPTTRVPYLEVAEGQCRFPLWDEATPMFERHVCGAPRCEPNARINHYCAYHARLCFVPPGNREGDRRIDHGRPGGDDAPA